MSSELVVLSHLRWTFVWQRPQQLVSRLTAGYDRTWFVEEPVAVADATEPVVRFEDQEHVTRVWLEVPGRAEGFDDDVCAHYAGALAGLLGPAAERTVWLYTPLALGLAQALRPALMVYDVMDDLAAFRFADPALVLRQRQTLREADLVFTGGRSLHRKVVERRPEATHCFPSGVAPDHYAPAISARVARSPSARPVAGYVGVIDERLDLDLLASLAEELPDWDLRMVGPVIKVDPALLPQAPNLSYLGPRAYDQLPGVMAGFDVALMPFALNEATQAISPTKTLEYLAAGLPVVSTRVPDVVADHADVVDLRQNGPGFAQACRRSLQGRGQTWRNRVEVALADQHWDTISGAMSVMLQVARPTTSSDRTEVGTSRSA